eukprot:1538831-Amphidinium_carterae.2
MTALGVLYLVLFVALWLHLGRHWQVSFARRLYGSNFGLRIQGNATPWSDVCLLLACDIASAELHLTCMRN